MHSRPLDIIYKPSMVAQVRHVIVGPLMDTELTKKREGVRWEEPHHDYTHSTLRDKLGAMLGGGTKVCGLFYNS